MALLQDAISSGEVTPRKLIISGLMYDSPLTIDGQAEAHAGEAIAIRNVSAEQVRLDDYHLMDPATGDSLHFPAVNLQPGKVLVVARPGAGSAGTVAGLEALAGIDPQVWAGEYTLWQAAGLPVLADGGGSLALVYTAEGGMQLEDEVEWGPGGLLAANGYNTAQPLALNRQVYQLGVESSSTYTGFDAAEWATTASVINPGPPPVLQAAVGERRLGGKRYELTDHLGNVRAVISDVRQATISGNVVSFATDVKSFTDYYAFGWAMPGRTFSAGEYRYGFNGKESAPELYGEGASYDFGARWMDARLGRWGSCDNAEAKYPNWSPYTFAQNSPIMLADKDGNDTLIMTWRVNQDLSTKYTRVYNVSFTLVSNKISTDIDVSEAFPNGIYVLANKYYDDLIMIKDSEGTLVTNSNGLRKQRFWKLSYESMSRHKNWKNTIRINSFGVFLHQGADISELKGCKIFTEGNEEEQSLERADENPVEISEIIDDDSVEGESMEPATFTPTSVEALAKLKNLYDSYKSQLTGDKFLLEHIPDETTRKTEKEDYLPSN